MKRSDILRKLNNINIEIGRLMAAQDSNFVTNMRVNANQLNEYEGNIKKLAIDFINGKYDKNDDKLVNIVAFGYDELLVQSMIEYEDKISDERKTLNNNDPNKRILKEKWKKVSDKSWEIEQKIRNLRRKRDALAPDLNKEISERRKAGGDEMTASDKEVSEKDRKEYESSIKGAKNSRRSCLISAIIWFAIALLVAIFFGPSIVNQIHKAGQAIMSKGLAAGEIIKECLKACLGVAVVAAPVIMGILSLMELKNFSDPQRQNTDNSGNIKQIKQKMEDDVLGICEKFINKLREEN